MTSGAPGVVLDTDIFSNLFTQGRSAGGAAATRLREDLLGWRVSIAFQTRAELLSGAFQGRWGSARFARLRGQLDRTATIPADDAVIEAFSRLTAATRWAGHPLHNKVHVGDRWVAACAVGRGLPLLSGDKIFRDVPELLLFAGQRTGPQAEGDVNNDE